MKPFVKTIFEYFGLIVFTFVVLVGVALLLPAKVSTGELLGLGLALVVIVGGFSWYYHFTSRNVGEAQHPPGPHPPGEGSTDEGPPEEGHPEESARSPENPEESENGIPKES